MSLVHKSTFNVSFFLLSQTEISIALVCAFFISPSSALQCISSGTLFSSRPILNSIFDKDNDVIAVNQRKAWGDKGEDVFVGVAGEGFAVIQDYTIGEDFVEIAMEGSWSNVGDGLMFTDENGDQIMLLLGIDDVEQVTQNLVEGEAVFKNLETGDYTVRINDFEKNVTINITE